ncbi:hypothetical protein DM872_22210 [Pseudomonas taiwanensis]|uniref:hypothetical protein n=1 Tax=Pseudomonas taiwanensis TaxID=470150 RepID=UPI0015BD29B0|nr:hypothetical protein [Pseudomonas taiwanensis]NWL79567.1 hypothetical protein [Pseudomonas taiwanensis]
MGRKAQQHWYALYQQLQPQVDSYQGSSSLNLFLRQLAEEVNYDAKMLTRMLKAGQFLDSLVGPLTAEQVRCGYAHIELLERLHHHDAAVAEASVPGCLSNEMTLKALREAIEASVEKAGGGPATLRSRARARVVEHERLCQAALLDAGPAFFGYPEGELIKVTHSNFFSQFFIVQEGQQPKVAIFARVGDTSRKEEKASADLLKLACLAQAYFEKVWILFPPDSSLIHELAGDAYTMGAFEKWLFLGTLNSETATIECFDNLERHLERGLQGDSPLGWEGIALKERRPARGNFVLRTTPESR